MAIIDYFRLNRPTLLFAYKWIGLIFTIIAVIIIVGGIITDGFIAESIWGAIALCFLAILYGNLLGLLIMLIIFFSGFIQNRRLLCLFSVKNKVFRDIFNLGTLCLDVNSNTKLATIIEIVGEFNNVAFKVVRIDKEVKLVLPFTFTKAITPEKEQKLSTLGIGIWGIGLYKKMSMKEWKDISSEDVYGILELMIKESYSIENEQNV
ncbi:hypothetical protein GGR21_001081 [Dysgonomonas hofstadii]|uniref:Uncharacterized protein n=1 Tax=Dysgonomonas hofstadii TaxID=637886 RepID=A0A840CRN9_9BACT|nr:hypothetical protein [Dysgonomonas hofstadii]MBB4035192.1 hypothetical protein [Dysgonomonas hofstadii]